MNDPNKIIDVNKSSLLSLKAELLRKAAEVNKAKLSLKATPFVPKKSIKSSNNEKLPEESKSKSKDQEIENSALLDKSKRILEAKSKLYDKLMKSGGDLNNDENCLVMFNQKRQEVRRRVSIDSSSDESVKHYEADNPDDDFVEYTDCLGRTRTCLRKDLNLFKQKDAALADDIQPRNQEVPPIDEPEPTAPPHPMWSIDTKGSTYGDDATIIDSDGESTATTSKLEAQKIKWEEQEIENANKESVHYQDVLFDEARSHGVGYYAFSTDQDERIQQQKELEETRMKTMEARKLSEMRRTEREKIIAERVRAAKNRQRARDGLPPLEDEPEQAVEEKEENERIKLEEEENMKKMVENEEKSKARERRKHVRPWDSGKSNKYKDSDTDSDEEEEWTYMPERLPMSQEQWNNKQREQRPKHFAPTYHEVPPQPAFNRSEPTKYNYTGFVRPNPVAARTVESDPSRTRAAIPPPNLDAYGPSSSKQRRGDNGRDLEKSIEAGLKFLRDQIDCKKST